MKRFLQSVAVTAFLASWVATASAQTSPIFKGNDSNLIKKKADVTVSLTFAGDSNADHWSMALYQDNEGKVLFSNSIENTSLAAGGTRKITLARAFIEVKPKGAWEVVVYTENRDMDNESFPENIVTDNDTINYIAQFGALYNNITPKFTHYLPLKIRSDALAGTKTVYEAGDLIPNLTVWEDPVDAEFGFIPEHQAENYGADPKILAQLGYPTSKRIGFSIAVDESQAGSGEYAGTLHFELRGN